MYNKKSIKLFLISGKARSGKGEIAKIIEEYYSNLNSITISFGSYLKEYVKNISNWDGNEETKPRTLLQSIGIELIKNKIDSKLLIRRVIEDIEVYSYFYDVIIIDDVRLIDEINSLKEKYPKSLLIRVIRENYDNNMTIEQNRHLTEINLDNYENFDYKIVNNNNYEDLKKKVSKILSEVEFNG